MWAHSGPELFYINVEGMLVAVEIEASNDFSAGQQRELFPVSPFSIAPLHQSYTITPDDRHFVMLQQSSVGEVPDLVVVLNWFEELKEMMGE